MNARFLVVTLLVLAACTPQVTVKHWPDAGKMRRVAVFPIKDAPGAPGSGEKAQEALAAAIHNIPAYELVERSLLDDVLKEHQLGTSGLVDESRAVEIGRLLNADSVLVARITEWTERRAMIFPPASVALSVRLVDAKTGVVEWSATHRVGGLSRLLTWILWPIGAYATATSPTADSQVQRASRMIGETVPKKAPR